MLSGPRQLGGSCTERRILKKPASATVCLIWQDTVDVCVCTAIFPASFPACLPCRGSQSPLSQLFLSCWRDLSVWVFVPALTTSHTESFLTRQKDVLSRGGDSMERRNSSVRLSVPVSKATCRLVFGRSLLVCLGIELQFTTQKCPQSLSDTCF